MEARFVQAGPVRLRYDEHGQGPEVVVFVHGYTASGLVWRPVQEALNPHRFRTIALSNRGAGDSDRTSSEDDYTYASFAQDLSAAMQALGLRDFTLVGHSLGGATVAQYALDHQDTLKALVLLNPAPLQGRPLPADWREQVTTNYQKLAANGATPAWDRRDLPDDFARDLLADLGANSLARLLGGRRSMGEIGLRERLTELRIPVLVAGGDRDPGTSSHLAEYLALPEPTRSLEIFHGIGHWTNLDAATELATVLDRFVTRTVAARSAALAS